MLSVRGKLTPYLANRRAQIEEYVKEWEELYPETKVFPPQHIPGHRNVSDLGTRGLAMPTDVSMGSEWQQGPPFLSSPVEQWPTSKENFEEIPEEEVLPKCRTNQISVKQIPPIISSLRSIFGYFATYERCVGTLARVLRVSREAAKIPGGLDKSVDEDKIKTSLSKSLTAEDYQKAEKIAFLLNQRPSPRINGISSSRKEEDSISKVFLHSRKRGFG